MVVPAIGINELLIGQVGNGSGITAGIVAIAGIGEQDILDRLLDNAVHAGHGALHLVEDHAVVDQLVLLHLVVPALLAEDVGISQDPGSKDRVQIHGGQIQEILLVTAGNGVHGLVGEGHGIEEGIHGALQQLHEGLLHGILVRAAQDAVLQNVENAGAVFGDGLEGD